MWELIKCEVRSLVRDIRVAKPSHKWHFPNDTFCLRDGGAVLCRDAPPERVLIWRSPVERCSYTTWVKLEPFWLPVLLNVSDNSNLAYVTGRPSARSGGSSHQVTALMWRCHMWPKSFCHVFPPSSSVFLEVQRRTTSTATNVQIIWR